MSKTPFFGGPFRGVTFGGSGVSIGGVKFLRALTKSDDPPHNDGAAEMGLINARCAVINDRYKWGDMGPL